MKSNLDRLFWLHDKRLARVDGVFVRSLIDKVDWTLPLIGITGARGVGKTTIIIQYLKKTYADSNTALYLSLDDIFFESNRLITVIENLYELGYRYFFLDEVHKYKSWSKDLKLVHDTYADVRVVFTGSSILDLYKGEDDLSRRAVLYDLPVLSFREFLSFEKVVDLPMLKLEDLLVNHIDIAHDFAEKFDVKKHFKRYLEFGCYPMYKLVKSQYHPQLIKVMNMVLEIDIPSHLGIDYKSVHTIKRLLYVIAQLVPFKPNVANIARDIESNRNKVLEFLDYLSRAQLIGLLKRPSKSDSYLTKPDMLYLHNSNLMYALSNGKINIGTARETFFLSQLAAVHQVNTPKYGDFMVDEAYSFEVGGPSKTFSQISGVPNAYLAIDGIDTGSEKRIPLWLFGLLY